MELCIINWQNKKSLSDELSKLILNDPSPKRIVSNKLDQYPESSSDENEENQEFIPSDTKHTSRIKKDFEYLSCIGKGAFGVVLKYKNKLDRKIYAIKKIKLNANKELLNKKIKREGKLLSGLNHENVVRYFTSWIELINIDDDDKNSLSTISSDDENEDVSAGGQDFQKQSTSDDDVYMNTFKKNEDLLFSSDDEEYDSDHDNQQEESDFDFSQDVFDENDINFEYIDSLKSKVHSVIKTPIQKLYFYIQMEYCENNTLRNTIDQDLYLDPDKKWRLFREVVEGLNHIHQKGIIHRDLKPDNIFIDSNDHVKIGDFGWATSPQPAQSLLNIKTSDGNDTLLINDLSLTGYAGTALYTAPEVNGEHKKAKYNQKVDIYSLGIILFEMSHPPLKTGMERMKILGNLRQENIIMPENFEKCDNLNEVELIRWILNHDGNKRPNCTDLLISKELPLSMGKIDIEKVLNHIISNKNSNAYRQLMKDCFQKELTSIDNLGYDNNFLKSSKGFDYKQSLLTSKVKNMVEKIFKLHGGVELITPLLSPSCQLYTPSESCVRLMTQSGDVVNIPYNLRIPFARYVVLNNISTMRRYSIERIYRKTEFHPYEFYECSFDIVNSRCGDHMAEAELLSIVCEVVNKLPSIKKRKPIIVLNHTDLFYNILMEERLELETIKKIHDIFSQNKLRRTQIITHLTSLNLPENIIQTLLLLKSLMCDITRVKEKLHSHFIHISKQAEDAINELTQIIDNAKALGVDYQIYISPLMVLKRNEYSGMMCKFVCDFKSQGSKNKFLQDIATGGRYDKLLQNMSNTFYSGAGETSCNKSQSAAGISISLEHLIHTFNTKFIVEKYKDFYDVYVCSKLSNESLNNKKIDIISDLWRNNIRASFMDYKNITKNKNALLKSLVIFVYSKGDSVKVGSINGSTKKFKDVSTGELVQYVKNFIENNNDDYKQLDRSDSTGKS